LPEARHQHLFLVVAVVFLLKGCRNHFRNGGMIGFLFLPEYNFHKVFFTCGPVINRAGIFVFVPPAPASASG
jgi:hypothetical protein